MFQVSIPRDAAQEVHALVTCTEELLTPRTFLSVSELSATPAALKLLDVFYAVEGGTKVWLWWDDDAGDTLLLPLEGRGRIDLTSLGGIANPRKEGWTGHVQVSSKGEGSFFLGLEFAKMTK